MEPDIETVARAYREVCWTGGGDLLAYRAAMRAYCAAHPGAETDPGTGHHVAVLIHEAAERGMLWAMVDGWKGDIIRPEQ
jgi:hypothetical protein